MSRHFHHPHQVSILLIPTQHLQFPVAGDQQERRGICPDMVQGRQRVDYRAGVGNSPFFPDRLMGDGVAAERNQPGNAVGIDALHFQPRLVESGHGSQITSRRMTRHENQRRIPAIFPDVVENPGDGCCCIPDGLCRTNLRVQPVVGRHNGNSFSPKLPGNELLSSGKSSPVKPDDGGKALRPGRIREVEYTPLPDISVFQDNILRIVWDVGQDILRIFLCMSSQGCEDPPHHDQKFFHTLPFCSPEHIRSLHFKCRIIFLFNAIHRGKSNEQLAMNNEQ